MSERARTTVRVHFNDGPYLPVLTCDHPTTEQHALARKLDKMKAEQRSQTRRAHSRLLVGNGIPSPGSAAFGYGTDSGGSGAMIEMVNPARYNILKY